MIFALKKGQPKMAKPLAVMVPEAGIECESPYIFNLLIFQVFPLISAGNANFQIVQ